MKTVRQHCQRKKYGLLSRQQPTSSRTFWNTSEHHLLYIRHRLSYLADFLQFLFVNDFDFAAIDCYQPLGGKLRQGTNGIRSSHVRQIGQIFPRKVNTQCRTILFQAIAFFQEQQRLGQTSPDVFLCQVNRSLIGYTQIYRQLLDENMASSLF